MRVSAGDQRAAKKRHLTKTERGKYKTYELITPAQKKENEDRNKTGGDIFYTISTEPQKKCASGQKTKRKKPPRRLS